MNLLFVCSRNKWRSRTAETIFKNNGQHQIRSAGTESSARIKINQSVIDWADVICVMEQKYRKRILEKFDIGEDMDKIDVLEIPDDYEYMDEELIEILKLSMSHLIAK